MNVQKIIINLNCIRSIIKLETPETRIKLFNTKLEKTSFFIRIPLKILYKKRILSILSILVSLKEISKTYNKINNIIHKDHVLGFYCTKNQYKAILRLFKVISISRYTFIGTNFLNANLALISLLLTTITKRKQLKYIGARNLSFLIETLRYIFYYEYLSRTIKKYPEIAIVANDHSPQPLAFFSLCKQRSCKIVYLQHGHVSKYFPPLYRFDLSVLFGQKSADIYLKIGKGSNQIALSGHNYRTANLLRFCPKKFNVTIFPNLIYDKNLIKLITQLKENDNVENVYIKPHPLHLPSKSLATQIYSFSKTIILKPDSNFQEVTDLGIAANSSIHIELLSQGINSVYYDELDEFEYDYYGFVHDKSVLPVAKIESLSSEKVNSFYQDKNWRNNISQFDSAFSSIDFMRSEIEKIKNFFNSQNNQD